MTTKRTSGRHRPGRLGTVLLAIALAVILSGLLLVVLWCATPTQYRAYDLPRGQEAAVLENIFDQELSHVASELASGRSCVASFYDTELNAFIRAKSPLGADYARMFGKPLVVFEDNRALVFARSKTLPLKPVVTLILSATTPDKGAAEDARDAMSALVRKPAGELASGPVRVEGVRVGLVPVSSSRLKSAIPAPGSSENDDLLRHVTGVEFFDGLMEVRLAPDDKAENE